MSAVSVLIIDDSAHNRRALTQMLESAPDVKVLDRASDGEEGLKKAAALKPDVITLDLEMPKLDGFAFLRLLMATAPTPVIVVSSYAHKADVFKALELGAFDFIAKPPRAGKEELDVLRAELLEKVRAVRLIRPERKKKEAPKPSAKERARPNKEPPEPFVLLVGASTGGPPAIQRLLESVAGEPSLSILVTQHMPPRFTQAFAERLDRIGAFSVSEAVNGDVVTAGHVYIAPGGSHLEVIRTGGRLELRTPPPLASDKHVPAVDRLFFSGAQALGDQALAIVLTGMGNDGAAGSVALKKAGGEIWAESEESAVIFGMPQEAIASGSVKRVLKLSEMGSAVLAAVGRRRK